MGINSDSGKVSGIKDESHRESLCHLRECMYDHNAGRNINIKGRSGKVFNKNEVTGNCRKVNPCYKMTKLLSKGDKQKK